MAKPNRRRPVSVSKYIDIHNGKMDALYDENVVQGDDLEFDFQDYPIVTLMGTVFFKGKVVLSVKKFMMVERHGRSDCLVTKTYSYQCHITGRKNSEIFRYDNYHEDNPHKGHTSPHHIHRFDPPGRQILNSPFEIRDEDRPLMDEIIREAYEHAIVHYKRRK